MSQTPNLRDAQRRMLQLTAFEDGLWELLMGTIFMLLAVYPITRARLGPGLNLGLFIGILLIVSAIQIVLRRWISMPRIGYVKSRRTPALRWLLGFTIGLVLLTFGLVLATLMSPGWISPGTLAVGPQWLRTHLVDILALLAMVFVFSALAYFSGVGRLYLYGWLVGGANLIAVLFYRGAPEGFNLPLGLAAGVVLAVGVVVFVRFWRKYPARALDA